MGAGGFVQPNLLIGRRPRARCARPPIRTVVVNRLLAFSPIAPLRWPWAKCELS
jgi:hypothetical protein